MMGEGTIVICVNGILCRNVLMDPSDKTGKMIRVYADGTIKQFVEDNSVANIRQRRLEEELGL